MHTFVLFAGAGDPPAPYRQPKAENTSMISLEAGERGMRHPAENWLKRRQNNETGNEKGIDSRYGIQKEFPERQPN